VRHFFAKLYTTITCQPIELESCPNPLKMQEVLQFIFIKNWKSFDFRFFEGDVINGVGSRIFGRGHRALTTKPMSQFFDAKFYWKLDYSSSH